MEGNIDSSSVDDEIFIVLAHPLRRKILKAIFEGSKITFSILSVEWGLVTGTIYHHLKILSPMIRSEERRVGKECRSRWSPYH